MDVLPQPSFSSANIRALSLSKEGLDWRSPLLTNRVAVYIDGFNLYYGMRSKNWRRYYWLDLNRLAERLLRPGQTLASVKYFTARVIPDADSVDKARRQNIYLEVLETLPDLAIHYGYYSSKTRRCADCGATWQSYEEKMTDVNIAVELLSDAYEDAFDTAIVISADSDLVRPITIVSELFLGKRVVVAFPPGRFSVHLRNIATASFTIGRDVLRDSQLPESVARHDGNVFTRPSEWN